MSFFSSDLFIALCETAVATVIPYFKKSNKNFSLNLNSA